jgi:CMP-N,N'-diacetyllegionaminic acid synthase
MNGVNEGSLLCTICARGGSKGVANKNIRLLAGREMIAYSIQAARASGLFAHVVVSTDSDAIAAVSERHGAEVFFRRPAELATDTAPKLPVIRHALLASEEHFNTRFDTLVDLDATSPLRSVGDIRGAIEEFSRGGWDSLITGAPARRSPYFNLVELAADGSAVLSKQLSAPVTRRQDGPRCFDMNASIYVWRREALLTNTKVIQGRTGFFEMPPERSVDVDSEVDFQLVELLLRQRAAAEGGSP